MYKNYNICYQLIHIIDDFLSFDEFKFVKDVGEWCIMSAVLQTCWTFYSFLIQAVCTGSIRRILCQKPGRIRCHHDDNGCG